MKLKKFMKIDNLEKHKYSFIHVVFHAYSLISSAKTFKRKIQKQLNLIWRLLPNFMV
jgi:hypothetical protein